MSEEEINKMCSDIYEGEDWQPMKDYIKSLQTKLQQKENKEKKIREYILTHKLYCFKYDEEELFEITTDKKAKDELLEILDKVSDEQWKRFGKM